MYLLEISVVEDGGTRFSCSYDLEDGVGPRPCWEQGDGTFLDTATDRPLTGGIGFSLDAVNYYEVPPLQPARPRHRLRGAARLRLGRRVVMWGELIYYSRKSSCRTRILRRHQLLDSCVPRGGDRGSELVSAWSEYVAM